MKTKMNRHLKEGILIVCMTLALLVVVDIGVACDRSSSDYHDSQVSWSTLVCGAEELSSSNHRLTGGFSQVTGSDVSQSSGYRISSGFWPGVSLLWTPSSE